MTGTSPRSEITSHAAPRAGHGSSRTWTRTIAGRRYSFTAITMPDGERRYAASRLDGADARFDCSWHRVGFWTVPAAAWTCDPHADVYVAASVTHGWHMEGVGVISYVYTHLNASVTLGGPQGYRTFDLDAFVEATPPQAPARQRCSTCHRRDHEVGTWSGHHFTQDSPAMIALPPLAVTKLAATLARPDLGAGYALGRLYVQANRDGSAAIYLAS